MITDNDYFIVWLAYLLASLGSLTVVWFTLARLFSNKELKWSIMLCSMAIFWTPASFDASGTTFWAPAFMAVLMESITSGSEAAVARCIPILFVMLGLLLSFFAWRFYLQQKFLGSHTARRPHRLS